MSSNKILPEQLQAVYQELAQCRLQATGMLAKIEEPELMLLKGHLLIEEILFDLLIHKMRKSSGIESARLSFAQVVAIVEGLYHGEDLKCSWLYAACRLLNKIRNRLAHNAEPEGIEKEVAQFVDFVLSKNQPSFSPEHPLRYALGSVHANFAVILTLHRKINLTPSFFRGLSFETQITISKLLAEKLPDA